MKVRTQNPKTSYFKTAEHIGNIILHNKWKKRIIVYKIVIIFYVTGINKKDFSLILNHP